jgi:hypothetical protein
MWNSKWSLCFISYPSALICSPLAFLFFSICLLHTALTISQGALLSRIQVSLHYQATTIAGSLLIGRLPLLNWLSAAHVGSLHVAG